jgi:hypothetical protein
LAIKQFVSESEILILVHGIQESKIIKKDRPRKATKSSAALRKLELTTK